jgi:hypothetical protein
MVSFNGSSSPFTGGASGPLPNPHADILTPAPVPQRPRNDPALDTSSIPAGGQVIRADPPAGSHRVQTGMTGPGNGGRMPFRIVGG